ncbi:MAG: hypothetical protein GX577_16445 [Leptolinea sp.]|nr:hypothetical protein [Leptolinea sp.]
MLSSLPESQFDQYNDSMKKQWTHVYSAYGQLDAAMLVDFLLANGIEATSIQESLGTTYGLTVGPLGEAKIFVPIDQKEMAETLIRQMQEGKLETGDEQSP